MRLDTREFAGRYELRRLVGRGGMADVYLAQDTKFGRLVALKFFRETPELIGARARFLKEAATAGRLGHPNIVTVYDYGEHEGEPYIAMEYIAGDTLARLIENHLPESLHDKIRYMTELCAALAFAHDAGVLHRDIKPANLMVAPSGNLKVLDFGIARTLDGSQSFTRGFAGSLHYMSPEQVTASPLDLRSDIFAVGAVFYELLTFKQAFTGDTIESIIDRIRYGHPEPLADACPGIDPAIVAVVSRALRKNPEERFTDLRSMARDLRIIAQRLPPTHADTVFASVPDGYAADSATDVTTRTAPEIRSGHDARVVRGAEPNSRWTRVQARLLDQSATADYLWFGAAGMVPLVLAWGIGALNDIELGPASPVYDKCLAANGPTSLVRGYASRWNWWPVFIILPLILFVLRRTARLFPLRDVRTGAGILERIPDAGRVVVASRLAAVALDARNLQAVLALALIITVIDLTETVSYYVAAAQGTETGCPRELDWTVRFLAGAPVSVGENALLLLAAYPFQVAQGALAMMVFGLLFRHNMFYLKHIYQRRRRIPLTQQVVLDFDDVERCFGLRTLHSIFNYQVALLIVGGLIILLSRFMNVDATPLGVQYEGLLSAVMSTTGNTPSSSTAVVLTLRDLFPDVGQMVLALAWLVCFMIVAMPSAVKFLPLANRPLRLVGRREYLAEFIPPTTSVPLRTQEEVDMVARKFSRSSFWPAGDERARTLYMIAYFVFFILLVPVPPTSRAALAVHVLAVFVLAYVCMKLTFWLFKRVLVNVDATLAEA